MVCPLPSTGRGLSCYAPYSSGIKTCCFCSAFNRYISVPLLQEWAGSSAKERGFFTRLALRLLPGMQLDGIGNRVALRFRRLVRIEALIIVGVLFCASLLRHEIPAKHYLHMKQGGGTMLGHEMHNMMGPQSP